MNAKFLLMAALLGGLTMFVWGAVSHMAIPWWNSTMSEFSNDAQVVDAVKAGNPQNGMYYSKQGLFTVVKFVPGQTDISANMGGYMVMEFIGNVLLALVLAYLLFMAKITSLMGRAVFAALVGFAAWAHGSLGLWNWYGFPASYTVVDLFDGLIGMFLVGFVLAWLMQKMKVAAA